MNKPVNPLTPYLSPLLELPFVEHAELCDDKLLLTTPEGAFSLPVEVRSSHLTYPLADEAIIRLKQRGGGILLAPYIGGPMGQHLAARGINYLDPQGNCRVHLGTRYIAEVTGRTAPKRARPSGIRAAGYQVLFALLAEPKLLSASVRTIAAAAGVSRQPVVALLSRLVDEGVLVRTGPGRTRSHRWVRGGGAQMLERWLVGYADVVRPQLFVGQYRLRETEPEAREQTLATRLEGLDWRWAGGSAGWRMSPHYRGVVSTVALADPPDALPRLLRAPPDRRGGLVVLRGPSPLWMGEGKLTHPLWTVSEMHAAGPERAREAALRLREKLELP